MAIDPLLKCFCAFLLIFILRFPAHSQDLSGDWQGAEYNLDNDGAAYWPSLLTIGPYNRRIDGTIWQVSGLNPGSYAMYVVSGMVVDQKLYLTEERIRESRQPAGEIWCLGKITLVYDSIQESLTGHSIYSTFDCHPATVAFYRIKLKSSGPAVNPRLTLLKVSGKKVKWYADPGRKTFLNNGNAFETEITTDTAFYLTQTNFGIESPVVKIAVQPAEKPVVLKNVQFKRSRAELLPESAGELDELVKWMNSHPMAEIRVEGHTDQIGDPEKNRVLSEERAVAVKQYLIMNGIAENRVTTAGYGGERTLLPSPNEANRRVEFVILKH
jgi:outer membrane protein OmpA-like peptidoglycan-associated protein